MKDKQFNEAYTDRFAHTSMKMTINLVNIHDDKVAQRLNVCWGNQ